MMAEVFNFQSSGPPPPLLQSPSLDGSPNTETPLVDNGSIEKLCPALRAPRSNQLPSVDPLVLFEFVQSVVTGGWGLAIQ